MTTGAREGRETSQIFVCEFELKVGKFNQLPSEQTQCDRIDCRATK